MKTLKNTQKINNKLFAALFISAFALFIFTMFFKLNHSALWFDEWVEYYYSQSGLRNGNMYNNIIRTFQPPLYNILMHFWLKLGKSLIWFRSFNMILGIGSGIMLYLSVKELCNKYIACAALIALAVCNRWVFCLQECSEYALMLFFLFASLYFFIMSTTHFSNLKMILFVFSCVGAIYSQYGSVFVVLPLLMLFYGWAIFNKKFTKKQKIYINLYYIFNFIVFAVPLYIFFLQKQMAHNEIGKNTVKLGTSAFKDLFITLGEIISFFYSLNSSNFWLTLGKIFTIILIVISIIIFIKNKTDFTSKALIAALWFAYILHFFLVKLHIYAMIHANQSAGFFGRYSFFYIPLLAIALPVIFYQLYKTKLPVNIKPLFYVFGGIGTICMVISFISTSKNWNKSYDDVYADIWIKNQGYEDTTYLLGSAKFGFDYYISHSDSYKEGYLDNASEKIDFNNLPESFWLWKTNYSNQIWQEAVDTAKQKGYKVTVYDDSDTVGQLAYCTIK